MRAHSIKTDNDGAENKVKLRIEATSHLESIKVLDLFAGENKLWEKIKTDRYYGVEKEKNKGKNLNADNMRVIGSLDLRNFNVIDCDSYGVPTNQIASIFKNETLQEGTVIIYTAITNSMSRLNKEIIKHYNLTKIYKKAQTLMNKKSHELFYGYLNYKGIKKVYMYEKKANFIKHYGYFFV